MWKITKDHLYDPNDPYPSSAGIQTKDYNRNAPNLHRVRLYDDDDILYYDALCTENDLEDLFEWSQRDSGTTRLDELVFKGDSEQGEWEQVIS